MSTVLTDHHLRVMRLRAQMLTGPPAEDAGRAVLGAAGLQAQDVRAVRLAVRARTAGLTAGDVRGAVARERSVVCTWAMRGTLHMVAAADVGWLVDLLGPVYSARGRRRRLELGIDDCTAERGLAAIRDVLAGGRALSRAELVAELAAEGVPIETEGQAPAHMVAFAAMRGVICRGPEREDEEPTYVLLRDWVGPWEPRSPESAQAELVRRYLAAYGPATPADFRAWSGLPARAVRQGWDSVSGELAEVATSAGAAWMLGGTRIPDQADGEPVGEPVGGGPRVRLLGAYDTYLLGPRGRDLVLPPGYARRIQAGGGVVHPVLLVDGEVVAKWRRERRAGAVAVEPFTRLAPAVLTELEKEVADLGRFLEMSTNLQVADS